MYGELHGSYRDLSRHAWRRASMEGGAWNRLVEPGGIVCGAGGSAGGGGGEVDLIGAGSSEDTTGVGSVGGGSSDGGGGLQSGGGRGGLKSNGVGGGDDMIEDAGFT
ncbi:PREDICTED: glycine-rich cell wall structural protein 1-like [Tarenaya hassleriana]|uniref:glycine-rich cell wall structural protein 1-like n=1 Tax=Tarenaya hassleriana TaxID=28532 RepID=UPI00053C5501|nr:PREDICTED: glycine-rich cell wall structural protein 1-like [Tarenaya hassleriana]